METDINVSYMWSVSAEKIHKAAEKETHKIVELFLPLLNKQVEFWEFVNNNRMCNAKFQEHLARIVLGDSVEGMKREIFLLLYPVIYNEVSQGVI